MKFKRQFFSFSIRLHGAAVDLSDLKGTIHGSSLWPTKLSLETETMNEEVTQRVAPKPGTVSRDLGVALVRDTSSQALR